MNDIFALIVEEEFRSGKKNPFWQMDIKTVDGTFRGVVWDVDGPDPQNVPRKGDLVKFDDYRDQRDSKYNNIIVNPNGFKRLKKEDLDQDLLDKLYSVPKATPEQLTHARQILTDDTLYDKPEHFAFVMGCLAKVPKEKLLQCPAARSVHHAFQGGLLVHTAEVVEICKGIISGFPYPKMINKDVILASATLHDIGKAITYDVDEIGRAVSLIEEFIIGHMYYGMALCAEVAKEKPVDKWFLNEVQHVIAAHHGSVDKGSIKAPYTLEALIVAQADYLGSRAGVLDTYLKPISEGNGTLPSDWQLYSERYMASNALKKMVG